MKTVLITGANRGLGLEFCRQYAAAEWDIIACCRNPDRASELANLARRYNNIQIHRLDVSRFEEIGGLSEQLRNRSVDVLLNNAGIYGDDRHHGFGNLDYAAWSNTFAVNVQAPVKMAEAFLSQIVRSDKKLIVAISSQMGSIADNGSGGSLLYRSSKAALNAAMKSLSVDLSERGVGVLVFHPGWVKTDMGGPNALISPEVSIRGMIGIIDCFDLSQTGSFIKYDGTPLPW
ncbi:MAG: SDR family oxidoreductase [Gammaproteobacteria bacterium]